MPSLSPASVARRIRHHTFGIVIAVVMLVAAFALGIGGHALLQAYHAIATHFAPVACGGAMQPCVKVR